MTYSSRRVACDSIRRRLRSPAARKAFDMLADELTDRDFRELVDGLQESGRDRAANLRDADDLRRARDDVNPANFVTRRDPRRYPANAANPGLRPPDSDRGTMDEADENEAEHAGIRREMVKKLKDAHEPTWRFMKERLSPEDFDALKRLILAEPDLDGLAGDQPYDFGGMPVIGGTQTPLANDEASSLPGPVFRALAAARHVRPDDNICRQDARATKRSRVVSLAFDGDEIARSIARIAPGAARVRLG